MRYPRWSLEENLQQNVSKRNLRSSISKYKGFFEIANFFKSLISSTLDKKKMVVAGYLIYNTNLRVADRTGSPRFVGSNGDPPEHKGYKSTSVKERAEVAFRLSPEKMENLVIVNSHLLSSEMIQACVEVADKYAENVMVIPPLLARLTYALKVLSVFRNPPKNECILVVTVTSEFIDFVLLRRDRNFELFIEEFECTEPPQYMATFDRFYHEYRPHSTIFLAQKSLKHVAKKLEHEFNPENCFIRLFNKWDYVLLYGALYRAMDDEHGFDTRYHIANFSSGFETKVYNSTNGIHERKVLLPERSLLPCNIYGFTGKPQMIEISYSPQYYFTTQHLFKSRRASLTAISASGSSNQAIGYVDERGVPYLSQNLHNTTPVANSLPFEGAISRSSSSDNNLSTSSQSAEITFLFHEKFFAVKVCQNGYAKLLKDSAGIAWTPLYLSTVERPVIGEKAKSDYANFPKHVIYDVMKIIGKSLNEIQIDPRWGFELINVNETIDFQVETSVGPRRIPQEIVIAAFMKFMKLQTQSELDTVIKEVHVATSFELNEPQKIIFEKAAAKLDLQILSFIVYHFN